ncbi:hypothetical protein [Galbibacter pacificus]|uniref:Uncharacterized protein n=1 Tax=Galbibacter pacificus TaxID=2996052 RepID=A0ABT6FT77_9FLAO|nr:hypothetical protein [Galbibacter pacificus]MDG3582569.1 hypothetical protein [Galbibacter pacificus]MDG3586312.1 hypothetical protein [Galbibacter pacificus]
MCTKVQLKNIKTIILIVLLLSMPSLSHAQCAMCRAVLETGGGKEVAEGINNGIVYLMAVPYVLIAVLGYFIFKRMK